MNQTAKVLIALLLGLIIGTIVAATGSDSLAAIIRTIEPLGTLWTNAIRMTVVPLVLALVINGVAGSGDLSKLGKMGSRAIPIFLSLLLVGAVIAMVVAIPAMKLLDIPPDVAESLRAGAAESSNATPPPMPSLTQQIIDVVPVNPIRAAADAAMLPLVFFALLFAIALTKIDPTRREDVVRFFRAVSETMLVLVKWVLVVAPIGIFALALGLGMRMGAQAAGALLYYVALLSAVLLIYTLLLYPMLQVVAGVSIRKFAAAAAPAQGIALSARSSLAALPAVVAGTKEHLDAPPAITGFALPLAVSIFRPNVPMAWVVGALFLGKLYGIEIEFTQMISLVLLSTFLSFSVPGIPSASLFLLAPVLIKMGIPAAGAAILIAVDAIPDMFKTTANVTSHTALAALLRKSALPEEKMHI